MKNSLCEEVPEAKQQRFRIIGKEEGSDGQRGRSRNIIFYHKRYFAQRGSYNAATNTTKRQGAWHQDAMCGHAPDEAGEKAVWRTRVYDRALCI